MQYKDYHVVCVDDDLKVLEIISDIIESLGHKVSRFSNAQDATKYIYENKSTIMLIISDLRMDNQNGFEFKKMLQNINIPFVILTGYWNKQMSSDAMELGIDAFIEKPVTLDCLKENIEKFGYARAQLIEEEIEMVEGFLEESLPMLDEIEELILELEENPSSDQTLSVYFRLLHTIKGTASCVGLTNLGNFTHKYEDFIGNLRSKKISVCTESTNVLLKGLDILKSFFAQIAEQGNDTNITYEDKLHVFELGNVENEIKETQVHKISEQQVDIKNEEKKEDEKMSVSLEILNDFMEESGELTVVRNTILKTVKKIEAKYRGDKDIENLNELLTSMHDVTSTIQGKITQMRQVPLKSTFRPFKRLVRDLSKKLNKRVDFEVYGEEMPVDTIVAKLFTNTLIHVVRNSLDHGLETPEERIAAGKNETGKLEFRVSQSAEDIVLKIVDDGKGINPEFIAKKAIEKNLFTKEQLEQMTRLEIINIIFASGFSTAEQVSDLSGRGVGMDMVRGSFEAMGGEIFVQSEVGQGSEFTLRVPIPKSVLIINTLSVSSGGQNFIFQMDDVAEVIRYEKELPNSKLYTIDGSKVISHNGEMIQVISLSKLMHLEEYKDSQITNIVVLRVGKTKFGVEVDEIFEFEEVVSRRIPQDIDIYGIYQGASLLGSGEVSMILSAQGLANHVELELDLTSKQTMFEQQLIENVQKAAEYMLFKYDDKNSLSIELDRVDRLETMNTKNFQAVGNNIIVKYLDRPLRIIDPAFILGLTEIDKIHNCAYDVDVPVIVVRSDNGYQFGMMVHKLEEIQYTFDELNIDTIDVDGLKGSVFINEKTICVVDIDKLIPKLRSLLKLSSHVEGPGSEEEKLSLAA